MNDATYLQLQSLVTAGGELHYLEIDRSDVGMAWGVGGWLSPLTAGAPPARSI